MGQAYMKKAYFVWNVAERIEHEHPIAQRPRLSMAWNKLVTYNAMGNLAQLQLGAEKLDVWTRNNTFRPEN